jgi:carboxyl-terminal processing protease
VEKRLFIYHKVFSIIENYFVHWEGVPKLNLEKLYFKYIDRVIEAKDRYEFTFLMKEVIGNLKNSHSWYTDDIFSKHFSMPMGFDALYDDTQKKWVVSNSIIKEIKVGDEVLDLDTESIEKFFGKSKKYINASSEREARNFIFKRTWLFPIKFKITLSSGKKVLIKRNKSLKLPDLSIKARFINQDTGYILIPSFADPKYQEEALKHIRNFRKAKSIIIDLRNNTGGRTPMKLMGALMDKRYRRFCFDRIKPLDAMEITYGKKIEHNIVHPGTFYIKPRKSAYKGKLFILANQRSVSASEDFLEPFKDNGRAMFIGVRTGGANGDPFTHKFHDGISVAVGALRVHFPDGKRFEGIGIKPDIEIYPKLDDLRNGVDTILQKALNVAKK